METPHSIWTLESLFKQIESVENKVMLLLLERDKMVALALASAEKAVVKAEAAMEKRLDILNEHKAAMSEKDRILMPRNEAEMQFNIFKKEIDELKTANLKQVSKGDGSQQLWVIILAVVGLVAGLAGIAARFF